MSQPVLVITAASPGPGPARPLVWALRLLAAAGLVIAGYLLVVSAAEGATPAGCGEGSGCEQVLASRWSKWFDVPVSRPALFAYAGILTASLAVGPGQHRSRRRAAWVALVVLAALVGGAALWFVGLQTFKLRSYCPWCMSLHACGLTITAVVLYAVFRDRAPDAPDGRVLRVTPGPRLAGWLLGVGLLGVGVLVAGQLMSSPITPGRTQTTFRVEPGTSEGSRFEVTNPSDTAPSPTPAAGLTAKATPGDGPVAGPGEAAAPAASKPDGTGTGMTGPSAAARTWTFRLKLGTLKLTTADVPVVGPAAAPHLVLVLNDYTCKHCRHLHHALQAARERYGDQMALAVLPVPLNAECNPLMSSTPPQHLTACKLARLALAVWQADSRAFPAMDEWLYEPEQPPTPEAARAYAATLVGESELRAALAHPRVEQTLQTDIAVYRTAGTGRLPKLIFGSATVEGVETSEEAFKVIEREFRIKPVPG